MSRGVRQRIAGSVGGVEFTDHELGVLKALVSGHDSNKKAARLLGLTPAAVAEHMKNIFHKLGKRSRVAVAVWAARQGMQ